MYKLTSAISHSVQQLSKLICCCCFGLAFLLTVYQVFSRFVLNSSWMLSIFPGANRFTFTWMEELIRYLFIWGVFVSAAMVYKIRQHASVDLVNHYMPKKVKSVLEIVVELICVGFFVLLLLKGIDMAKVASLQRSPSLKINMAIMYSSIIVCSAFCLIHSFHFLVMRLTGRTAETGAGSESSSGEVHA